MNFYNMRYIPALRLHLPLLMAVLVLVYGYLRFNAGYAVDDSYITFRYAQNALAGYGFVFNPGQHYYGSTATGYAMLLAGLVKLCSLVGILVDIPQVSTLLSALAIGSLCWLCGRACLGQGRLGNQVAAVAVALFVAVLPLSSAVAAHETYAFLATLGVGSYLVIKRRALLAGTVLFVVAMTLRPDSLLFVLIAFSGLMFARLSDPYGNRYTWRELGIAAAIFVAGVLLWVVSMKLYYGTFFPGTMDAKKAQVQMGYWPLFGWKSVNAAMKQLFGGRYWWLLALPGIACLVRYLFGLRRRSAAGIGDELLYCAVWTLFAVGVFCAYVVFHVTLWTWYVVPMAFALLLSAAYGIAWLGRDLAAAGAAPVGAVGGSSGLPWSGVAVLVAGLAMSPGLDQLSANYFAGRNINGHLTSYDPIMWYLKKFEPEGTSVAIAEPGTFGYKLGPSYQVLDVLGLASPGVAKALREGNFNYVVPHWKPKYVVTSWQGRYNPDQQPGFGEQYELVGEFKEPYWDALLPHGAYLYRRKSASVSP